VVDTGESARVGTFLFADIAGYTALTEAHGDEEAAELARGFCRAVAERARAGGGEVVKTIGDAVMVRHENTVAAVELGLAAAHEVLTGHGSPAVRVGLHHGPALEQDGDWFGATVNLAARIAGLAAGGEVLMSVAVLEAVGELPGVALESRGEHRLRNISAPVALFAAVVDARTEEERHLDPVCRMLVAEGREAGMLRHREATYRFCSLECVRRFLRDPDAYIRA
jgi:adenylate cyclase